MFNIVSDKFFIPLASPNKQIYWECICKLFGIMNHQLSFGIERDVLVEELQYYFEQEHAIEIEAEDNIGKNSRDKANWMSLFKLTTTIICFIILLIYFNKC